MNAEVDDTPTAPRLPPGYRHMSPMEFEVWLMRYTHNDYPQRCELWRRYNEARQCETPYYTPRPLAKRSREWPLPA